MKTLFKASKSTKSVSVNTLVFRQVYAGKTRNGVSDAVLCGMRLNKNGEVRHLAQLTVKDGEQKGSFFGGVTSYQILPTGETVDCSNKEVTTLVKYLINVPDDVARAVYDAVAANVTTTERGGVKVSDCQLHIRCRNEDLFYMCRKDGSEWGIHWSNVISIELVTRDDKQYITRGIVTMDGDVHARAIYKPLEGNVRLDEAGCRQLLQPIRRVVDTTPKVPTAFEVSTATYIGMPEDTDIESPF